jgi:FMN reductase
MTMSASVTSMPVHASSRPVVLGLGGTLSPSSTSELALRHALSFAEDQGAVTEIITASELQLPMYEYGAADDPAAQHLLEAVRRADHLIISSPGYHGGMSGLLKNALDYLQELAADPAPYLHDKAVGCIVAASGWQAGATTLGSLRDTVHALRGWPTPLGVVINSATGPFDAEGGIADPRLAGQLASLAEQVTGFPARHSRALA